MRCHPLDPHSRWIPTQRKCSGQCSSPLYLALRAALLLPWSPPSPSCSPLPPLPGPRPNASPAPRILYFLQFLNFNIFFSFPLHNTSFCVFILLDYSRSLFFLRFLLRQKNCPSLLTFTSSFVFFQLVRFYLSSSFAYLLLLVRLNGIALALPQCQVSQDEARCTRWHSLWPLT